LQKHEVFHLTRLFQNFANILIIKFLQIQLFFSMKNQPIRVLVVGCGNMGTSHAMAYHQLEGFRICGIVSTGNSKHVLNEKLGGQYPLFSDYAEALQATQPDAVCISTYPDTHEPFALMAFAQGCHVFMEKPIADSLAGAQRVAEAAHKSGKKLVIGYILRHHPSWMKFVEVAQQMGKPLVMRMNLNQQSQGFMWDVHRNLMKSLSPIVDCGVHYIDVMCQMTRSKPVWVSAIGAQLTDQIPDWNYNYGQLQIRFEDGSVGWYEAGWGPMMSETAFFVKDVIGPKGCVSIVAKNAGSAGQSDNVDAHTKTESLRVHLADIDAENRFVRPDEWIDLTDEPDHQELCNREQTYFEQAIRQDWDLHDHVGDAVSSLAIAFACDESVRTGEVVRLP
jgi:predicted dehydrogenase